MATVASIKFCKGISMSKIVLSEKSIKRVIKICETVRSKVPKFAEMAEGISKYAQEKSYLSERQAAWVCQNASYWKLKRPSEMVHVKWGTHSASLNDRIHLHQGPASTLNEILRRLSRIENILKRSLVE